MADIRNVKFYVVAEGETAPDHGNAQPLEFDEAYRRAEALADSGAGVHVLYTDGADQMQLTRFASRGIPVSLVPEG